ncbi:hypothetical protein BC629DRAFT_1598614 [Irpex lacteus]|nr:hypothetical protein BC629DRAFT_1598614 [Irpex lacteus]
MKFFTAALIIALPLIVSANPLVSRQGSSPCPTGAAVSCCNSLHSSHSEAGKAILKNNNLENHPFANGGMVAAGCNTGLGITDASTCATTPTCCFNEPGSLVAVGCLPVIL